MDFLWAIHSATEYLSLAGPRVAGEVSRRGRESLFVALPLVAPARRTETEAKTDAERERERERGRERASERDKLHFGKANVPFGVPL